MWFKTLLTSLGVFGAAVAGLFGVSQSDNEVLGYVNKFNPFTNKLDRVSTSTDFIADFLYKPGVAGGQTASGGTGLGDALTLRGTALGAGGVVNVRDSYLNLQYDALSLYASHSTTPVLTGESNYAYTRFGINNTPFLLGEMPTLTDPLNRIAFVASRNSNLGYGMGIHNTGTGTESTAVIAVLNNLSEVGANGTPTHATIIGRTGGNWADPVFGAEDQDASMVYSTGGNLLIGSAGTTSTTGNTYIMSGGIDNKNKIRAVFSYDGKIGMGTLTPTNDIDILRTTGNVMMQVKTNDPTAYAQFRVYTENVGAAFAIFGANYAGTGGNPDEAYYKGNAAFQSVTDRFAITNEKATGDIAFYVGGYGAPARKWTIAPTSTYSGNPLTIGAIVPVGMMNVYNNIAESGGTRTVLNLDSGTLSNAGSRLIEAKNGGTTKFFVDKDGRTSIGTFNTSMTYDLYIQRTTGIAWQETRTLDATSFAQARVYAGTNALALAAFGQSYAGTGSGTNAAYRAGNASFQSVTPSFTLTNEYATGTIQMYVGGFQAVDNKLTLDTDGLVIGTNVPDAKAPLHLAGSTIPMTFGNANLSNILSNAYYSSGYKRINASAAPAAIFFNPLATGQSDIGFYNADEGTADSAITWVNRLMILENGYIGVSSTAPKSTFDVQGSFATKTDVITTSTTLSGVHQIVIVSNDSTITLPTAVGITGRQYNIIRSGTSNVLINTTSSQTISGDLTLTLTSQWDSVVVVSDGSNWVRCS